MKQNLSQKFLSSLLLGLLLLVGPAAAKPQKAALGTGAAFSPSGELWISGLNPQGRLFVQSSPDAGASWSAPTLLNIGDDRVSADGENRPKLAFGPDGLLVISYTKPLSKPYTGDIRLLRSTDGGKSFAAPVTVHANRQLITHRFESIAFDAKGVLHTVWIDKRDLENSKARGQPYRGAALYRNESRDGGASFGPDLKLADHSCECCRIALSPTPEGGMAAMWRHVFEPNQRDHAFARLEGDAPALQRATLDRWAVDGCPHHGPGLVQADGGAYHAVWFGLRGMESAVRYGRLDAEGRPEGEARALPDAGAEHADLMAAGQQLAIVWRSFDGKTNRLRAWVSADGGRNFKLQELASSLLDNDHPRLLRHQDHIYALWRTAENTHVVKITAP
ncbi:MAG: exo-alpha-sialidase [Paucibacter sp.]|nr:exo-alpha-sialidase [Roseateles sp.]